MNIKRLKEKRGLFNTKMIEGSCDIPSTVLASYFSGRRNTLKEDHVENIEKYLRGVFEYLFEPLSHESVQLSNPSLSRESDVGSMWVKVDNIGKYNRQKDGTYVFGDKKYETKFDGGIWVREI